jgi:adenylate cyclase
MRPLINRRSDAPMPVVYRFHGFSLDTGAGTIAGPLGPLALRPKAFALLTFLVQSAGQVLEKEAILEAVWPGVTVTDETLTQTLHELRRALGDDAQALIRTVPRRGYVFASDAFEAAPSGRRRLAILPFVNLSTEPEQEFFAAGLGLDLQSALGLIDGIEVHPDGARAEYQLSGSVRAAGGRIRDTARLVEMSDGLQMWSDHFDGRTDEIFALQDAITRNVAVAMQMELTNGDFARLWAGQTTSLKAWQRYVVAQGHYLRWSEADNSRARDLLKEALALDPGYGAAKVMLGKTWWYEARFYTSGDARLRAIAEAERLAKEVLDRQPDAANALMLLGGTEWLRDHHDEAVAMCRRASMLSPSDSWALGFFGVISIFSGDLDEALVVLGRAARLSPQTFSWIDFHVGHARAWAGDDAGAQASLRGYITSEPDDPWGYIMLAVSHGFADRADEARRSVAKALQLEPDMDQERVRRSHRYRDPSRLDRVIRVLACAGLPA